MPLRRESRSPRVSRIREAACLPLHALIRPVSVVCAERPHDGGDEVRAASLALVSPIDNAEAVRDVFCESSRALVALVALMLFAWLLIDPRGIYLSGSLPCGLRNCNLRHPSLARAPATSPTMLCRCDLFFLESSFITHSTGRRRALARRPPQGP